MNIRNLLKLGVIAAISTAMFSCGGGGGTTNTNTNTPLPEKTVSGAALKDFMIDSTVVVYDASGKKVGEGKTTDHGRFSVKIPGDAQGPFLVVVSGGKLDKDGNSTTTNDTISADNVTLAAPVPEDAVETEKVVAVTPVTTAVVMNVANVTDVSSIVNNATEVIKEIANKTDEVQEILNTLPLPVYISTNDTVIEAVEEAVSDLVEAVNSTAFENGTFNPESLPEIVEKIKQDIADGKLDGELNGTPVYENATVVSEITEKVHYIKAVSLTIGNITDDNLADGLQIVNATEEDKQITVTLDVSKGAYDKTYVTDVIFSAEGTNGDKRTIKAVLKGVKVSIDSDGNIKVVVPENATIEISGTNSLGNPVEGTLTNINQDIITSEGNKITYDLSIIQNKLESINATDPLHDLADIMIGGHTYNVLIDCPDLPGFFPIKGSVSVLPNETTTEENATTPEEQTSETTTTSGEITTENETTTEENATTENATLEPPPTPMF